MNSSLGPLKCYLELFFSAHAWLAGRTMADSRQISLNLPTNMETNTTNNHNWHNKLATNHYKWKVNRPTETELPQNKAFFNTHRVTD